MFYYAVAIGHKTGVYNKWEDCKKNIEKTNWENIVYIGDNPHKDFVNLNKVNAITIRILKGDYANHKVVSTYDAKHKIYDLNELYDLLKTNL